MMKYQLIQQFFIDYSLLQLLFFQLLQFLLYIVLILKELLKILSNFSELNFDIFNLVFSGNVKIICYVFKRLLRANFEIDLLRNWTVIRFIIISHIIQKCKLWNLLIQFKFDLLIIQFINFMLLLECEIVQILIILKNLSIIFHYSSLI